MSALAANRLQARIAKLVRRWRGDARGVAAVEFALIVPIMGVMFIGAVELSQAITVDRRVTQIASSTADLVARADKQISQTEINDIMRAGSFVMSPFSQAPLNIVIRNVTSSPTSATNTKQSWSCTYQGSDTGTALPNCSCSNTSKTIPPNLVTTNDSVVISEVVYAYKPLVFDYFMKRGFANSPSPGVYNLTETIYLKPRGQAAMLLQPNNVVCPSPTF